MILKQLLSGALVLGAKINQADLVKKVGTSITPIREVLTRLQARGLVRFAPVPYCGAFVEMERSPRRPASQ